MNLTDRELDTLWLFARGAVTAIPAARELVEKLHAEVKRCHAEIDKYNQRMAGMATIPKEEYLRLLRSDAKMDAMATRELGEL